MTTPHIRKWDSLTGDEKVSWIETVREQRSQFHDAELEAFRLGESARRRRIKKHTAAILKLRAS